MEKRDLFIWHKAPSRFMSWEEWIRIAKPGVYLVEEIRGPYVKSWHILEEIWGPCIKYDKFDKFIYLILIIRPESDLEVRMVVAKSFIDDLLYRYFRRHVDYKREPKWLWVHMLNYGYLLYYELRPDGSDGFFLKKTQVEPVDNALQASYGHALGLRYVRYYWGGDRYGFRLDKHLINPKDILANTNDVEDEDEDED